MSVASSALDHRRVESLSELVLRTIYARELSGANGPTVEDVAADLGIPTAFGHQRLSERLQRQVALGRVYSDGAQLRLTQAGRLVAMRTR
jgi:hypothetical protein